MTDEELDTIEAGARRFIAQAPAQARGRGIEHTTLALVAEVRLLRECLREERDIISDYRSGRIVTCPEHGIAIQMEADPVEVERDSLRAEVERLETEVDALNARIGGLT